jgi:hypothetical protein
MTENYTPAQRFQLAAERIEIERKRIRGMSNTVRIRGESSEAIMQEIMEIVCKAFAVTEEQVRGLSRLKAHAQARHAYAYLCIKLDPTCTLVKVGNTIGRDHSTIINSIKKTEDLRLTDYRFAASFNMCLNDIADSNSKFMKRLKFEPENIKGGEVNDNELHKSLHALTIVHDFMLAYSAYEIRKGDGDMTTDELVSDITDIRQKAINLGF